MQFAFYGYYSFCPTSFVILIDVANWLFTVGVFSGIPLIRGKINPPKFTFSFPKLLDFHRGGLRRGGWGLYFVIISFFFDFLIYLRFLPAPIFYLLRIYQPQQAADSSFNV